jgi:hypothetical protein
LSETVRLALAILATYRIAQLVAHDDGPADVFLKVRVWAGCYEYGADGRPARAIGRLMGCPYCVGVWAAVLGVVLWMIPSAVGDVFLGVLGIAGAQAFLEGRR